MRHLNKYELAEIHSMMHPPKIIKCVMKCVCILLEVQPVVKKTKKGEYKPSYWRAAISDKVLGNPNLPEIMENFDRNKLDDDMMSLVEEIISQPDYNFENAKKSCFAI
jgi:hypothetical protein